MVGVASVSVGQIVVLVSLMARIYGVDPAMLDCMAYRESSYNVEAVNGVHVGTMQWNPDTLEWLAEKAAADPLWLHGYLSHDDPVFRIALAAWAVRNGYGEHWETYSMCGGE